MREGTEAGSLGLFAERSLAGERLREALLDSNVSGLALYGIPEGEREAYWRKIAESPAHQETIAEVREEFERLKHEKAPELPYSLFILFRKEGSRREYEIAYFERRRRLNTFALLALLEPEREEYGELLADAAWAICDEYTWCLPAHAPESNARFHVDLFAAETAFTLSELAVLFGEKLPPLIRERIGQEVEERVFRPYLQGRGFPWETAEHNWSAVCAGSIAGAALLTMRSGDPRLATIVEKTVGSMECYLRGFGEDGVCLEGMNYWIYGFGYYCSFADLLYRRTGGRADLMAPEKVRRIALFPQKGYLAGDAAVNFSDSAPRVKLPPGLMHYLAERYPDAELPPAELRAAYADDPCSRWAPILRGFLWADPAKRGSEWSAADYYLPDAEWLVSRQRTGAGTFGFAAKGGHNDEPHNHNDIGQFILHAGRETFVSDLGSGEYTADYFGSRRYAYDCNGSQGHAVPIVNGTGQAEGRESAAKVLESVCGDEEARFAIELSSAYRQEALISLVRSFVWRKAELPSLVLTDEYAFSRAPDSVEERIITRLVPRLDSGGSVLLHGDAGISLRIRYDPGELEASAEQRSFRGHSGDEETYYALDFAKKSCGLSFRIELRFEFERTEGTN
ncbi:hypothetical protein ELR57_20195 [Cohnella sp. AR92]|nr:hypothetical protein ELR57_20195 [Cohnella sp. AR92]